MLHSHVASAAGLRFQTAETTTPTPEPGTEVFDDVSRLVDACGEEPDGVCEWVFNRTDNETLASFANWFVDMPLRIIFIVIGALVVKRLVQRAIRTFAAHLVEQAADRVHDL